MANNDGWLTEQEMKEYVAGVWGFNADRVEMLEADKDPDAYLMFEVAGVQYQAINGVLSIYSQPSDY